MPLKVISLAQYLTVKVEKMRDEDFAATSLVKVVKGEAPKGRPQVKTFAGRRYEFGPGKLQGGIDFWCAWAAPNIRSKVQGPIVLVPVPNSGAVVGSAPHFRTATLAHHLAAAIGESASVATELWWSQQMTPAHKKGPRFAEQLYPFMVGARDARAGTRVLVDDVMTSGGHFRASATKLKELGHDCTLAICCGRSLQEQLPDPFDVPIEDHDDFDPQDPQGLGKLFRDLDLSKA